MWPRSPRSWRVRQGSSFCVREKTGTSSEHATRVLLFHNVSYGMVMLITLRSVPLAQDSRIVIACIRACIWASLEDRPFCVFPKARRDSMHRDPGELQQFVDEHTLFNQPAYRAAASAEFGVARN